MLSMKKSIRTTAAPALIAAVMLLGSCIGGEISVRLPDKHRAEQRISQIIEDRFDDPVLISENRSENTWEVSLPDRNGLKVQFNFYKENPSVGIDGSELFNYWELRCRTDYIWQIVSTFDNSLKDPVDEKYGIIPGSTETSQRFKRPAVTVHTGMEFDELTDERAISYINECVALYDFRAVQYTSYSDCDNFGVETVDFIFVMDNVPDTDGEPFEYLVTLSSNGMSGIKMKDRGKYIDEKWAQQQMSMQKAQYLYRLQKEIEKTSGLAEIPEISPENQ